MTTSPAIKQVFSWTPNDRDEVDTLSKIIFTYDDTKMTIYIQRLTTSDAATMAFHIEDYISKMEQQDVNDAQVIFNAFPKTLSSILKTSWMAQYDGIAEGTILTSELFALTCKNFIADHVTADVQCDALEQLRSARKPRSMTVRNFRYRFDELNGILKWFPGTLPVLTADERKQYIYSAMPPTWQEKFVSAGKNFRTHTIAQIVDYFQSLEVLSNRRQEDNQKRQKKASGDNKPKDKRSAYKGKKPFVPKDKKTVSIDADSTCPVHPDLPHSWGRCFSNPANKNKKRSSATMTKDDAIPRKKANHSVTIDDKSTGDNHQADVAMTDKKSGFTSDSKSTACFADLSLSFSHPLDLFQVTTDCFTASVLGENVDTTSYMSLFHSSDFGNDCQSNSDNMIVIPDNDSMSNLIAISLMTVKTIHKHESKRALRVLFDTGSTGTWINKSALPKGVIPTKVPNQTTTTIHGTSATTSMVTLREISFPEFNTSRRVTQPIRAYVFDSKDCAHDIILGNDVLIPLGIDVLNSTRTVKWMNELIPMHPRYFYNDNKNKEEVMHQASFPEDILYDDPFDNFHIDTHFQNQKNIKESKYDYIDTDAVAKQQHHLSSEQQNGLAKVLSKYQKLFSGKLGLYPHKKLHLELHKDAVPVHQRPYGVAHAHRATFKQELDRLCEINVLEECGASEWGAPTFIIPKKDGRVRWVSDFRALNKCIKRKVYPLPRISEVLSRRKGYKFFSKLDISMQYYTFELDDESKELCVIVTPFGKYRYNRAPMGVKQSPDFAQEIMEHLLRAIEEVEVYIDDIGCFNDDWQSHLNTLDKVLTILQDNNFTINPLKCEWGVQETDWLGFWLTPTGLKPWKKKIDAILKLRPPSTRKMLRSFIGAVTFYRDMFPKRSHVLAPLTANSSGHSPLNWTNDCQSAFDQVKSLLSKDVFVRYPDHNKPFHVFTDASDYQLGAVIMQENIPVAYFSRKLNSAQRNYTTMEKELLSIVETLKEYRNMLYGCKELHVHTDHKNLTYANLTSQRVLRWRLFLEEFNPIFHHIAGIANTLADALSRLPSQERQDSVSPLNTLANKTLTTSTNNEQTFNHGFSIQIDDDDMLDCFLNLPTVDHEHPFMLEYTYIAEQQDQDAALLTALENDERLQRVQMSQDANIICYRKTPNDDPRIYIPDSLLERLTNWYHQVLNHPGMNRLYETINTHMYNSQLRKTCENVARTCDACQKYKLTGRGYGDTPPRQAQLAPWHEVAVDLIGPWKISIPGIDEALEFRALTTIDTVSNLPELIRINNKTSEHVATQFENSWLARYPRPIHIIYDQGTEFKGYGFQRLLRQYGIRRHPTTVKNPQANSICERLHQTIGNNLRTLLHTNPPNNINDANLLIDTALATAGYSARAAMHHTLKISPGALVFHRDMLLDIPVISDLQLLQQRRQTLIDKNLLTANSKRRTFDYQPNQECLKLVYNPGKLEPRAEGPYRIVTVHTNGTVTLQLTPLVRERISIRRIKPYRR